MDRPKLEIEGVSVVVLGDFNPAMFRPMWFSRNGLVRDEEPASAATESGSVIVTPATAFFTMGWLSVHVLTERLEMSTVDAAQFSTLRDVAAGTMQLLSHTPARAAGINYDCHFRLEPNAWVDISGHVVDLERWRGVLESPTLQTVVLQGARPEGREGSIRLKVESSPRVRPGVYIQVNEHVAPVEGSDDIGWLLSCLNEDWDEILGRSRRTVDETLGRIRL
jgi:hypothetical protein